MNEVGCELFKITSLPGQHPHMLLSGVAGRQCCVNWLRQQQTVGLCSPRTQGYIGTCNEEIRHEGRMEKLRGREVRTEGNRGNTDQSTLVDISSILHQ